MSNDFAWAENIWEHQEPPEGRFIKDEDEDDEERCWILYKSKNND